MTRLRLISALLLLSAIASIVYIRVIHGRDNDTIAPVISMDQTEISISVEDDEYALLEGVTAKDNRDGDVTDSLTVDNISTFNSEGKRYVTIAAFDGNNNVGKATREISYTDYRPPHFDITEPMVFSIGATRFFDNITANDVLDGDVTGSIHFEDNTRFLTSDAGDYNVVIQVKNSAGDVASLPLTISIMDKAYDDKPQVHLKHYVRYTKKNIPLDYANLMDYVFIGNRKFELVNGNNVGTDTIGRDKIRINDDGVTYDKPGIYTVNYKLTIDQGEEKVTGTTKLIVVVED